MLFNENEMRELVKLRMEETERKARDAWKFKRESWLTQTFQRLVPPNGECACQCG